MLTREHAQISATLGLCLTATVIFMTQCAQSIAPTGGNPSTGGGGSGGSNGTGLGGTPGAPAGVGGSVGGVGGSIGGVGGAGSGGGATTTSSGAGGAPATSSGAGGTPATSTAVSSSAAASSSSSAASSSAAAGSSSTGSGGVACLQNIPSSCPDCATQNMSDVAKCQAYLTCYETNNCNPADACGSQDAVCGVNTVGGGTAPQTAAIATYNCACP